MRRRHALASAAALTAGIAAVTALAAEGDLTRVSVTDGGAQSPQASTRTAVSADGTRVAFVSAAELTGTPTGGKRQVYVRDLRTGRTLLASQTLQGQAANQDVAEGDSFNPYIDISGNGRYVVFQSAADNLVPGDANGTQVDVFRKDLETGAVTIVSVTAAGQQGAQSVPGDPSVSFDGTRVAYRESTNATVVRDLLAGTTTLVSKTSAGEPGNNFSERPAISANGWSVAFETGATNLFPGDNNAVNDVMVHNLATGITLRASEGVAANGANIPDVSGDGRVVVFQTAEKLDAANDPNNGIDVYARDVVAGTTTLASGRNGLATASAAGDSGQSAVSADGARVAFRSGAADLTAADGNNATEDVYARTLATRVTVRASARADGSQVATASETPAIAPGGGAVAFVNPGALNPADSNNLDDVYLKELTRTDAVGPTLTVTASASPVAGQVRVTGSAGTDPSGIGAVTVNGTVVRAGLDGSFSADIPSAGARTDAAVVAVDGAGNSAERVATFIPSTGGGLQPGTSPPRLGPVTARLRGRTVTLTVRLDRAATVRAELLRPVRRTVRGKRVVRLVRVGRPLVRALPAGTRRLALRVPALRPGAYRLRVTASAAGGRAVRTVPVIVRRTA